MIPPPPTELELDFALDAAAEKIANPKDCTCERCEDAVTEERLRLLAEGRERASESRRPAWKSFPVTCAQCGGEITAGPQWGEKLVGCPKCAGSASHAS